MAIRKKARMPAKRLGLVISLAGILFLLLQLVRPELKNPPITAEMPAPSDVKHILRNSCYNCHSNEIRMPWYDKIVPVYWLVTRDVNSARKRLNFSEVGTKQDLANAILYQSVYEIQKGDMPPRPYRILHPEAAITPEQLAILRAYITQETATAKKRRRQPGP
jgi:hypothetical protein